MTSKLAQLTGTGLAALLIGAGMWLIFQNHAVAATIPLAAGSYLCLENLTAAATRRAGACTTIGFSPGGLCKAELALFLGVVAGFATLAGLFYGLRL